MLASDPLNLSSRQREFFVMNTMPLHAHSGRASDAATPNGIPPTKFAHCVIYTTRFPQMVRWYKTVLVMRASHEDDSVAFLTFDDEHHRIALVQMAGLKDRPKGLIGFHHVAFTYSSLRDLLLTHERLTKAGIQPYWAINHGPTTSLYFLDPDGNRVELQVDNFDTAEEGIAFCALPEFAENPVGVEFDPPSLLSRLRAGESEVALKKRPNMGPRSLATLPSEAIP
jgi:catechol 2,3-dioxygenase-like lactoylglutathione lyase family enzyme